MRAVTAISTLLLLTACARFDGFGLWGGGEQGGAGREALQGWSYEGPTGPAHWGHLAAACAAGEEQSPIELAASIRAEASAPDLRWRAARAARIVNDGHTIRVDLEHAGAIVLDGHSYALSQIHFHHMSEHTVAGRAFPMEAHFVHADAEGRLAMVGVFIEDGARSPLLDAVWAAAPSAPGEAALNETIDPRAFLPESRAAYRYRGSLTTPPCSEIVDWTVFAEPIEASAEQVAIFAHAFPDNARPIQPLGRRYVLRTQ